MTYSTSKIVLDGIPLTRQMVNDRKYDTYRQRMLLSLGKSLCGNTEFDGLLLTRYYWKIPVLIEELLYKKTLKEMKIDLAIDGQLKTDIFDMSKRVTARTIKINMEKKRILEIWGSNNSRINYKNKILLLINSIEMVPSLKNELIMLACSYKKKEIDDDDIMQILTEIISKDMFVLFGPVYHHIYENIKNRQSVKDTEKYTSLYTCGKCKRKECVIINVIKRRLDEGVNNKVICKCGNSWYV